MHGRHASVTLAASLAAAAAMGPGAIAHAVTVTNLVSDGSVPAMFTDPNLINPWGLASSPTGPIWVSDNNAGVSTIYAGNGKAASLVVTIPGFKGAGGTPDGVVFNSTTGFQVKDGNKKGASVFIFSTEDGTIDGWSPNVDLNNAEIAVNNHKGGNGAVYKGDTLADVGSSTFLYVANFRGGDVEVYNSKFKLVNTFTDPTVKAGYAPFNVQELNGKLYVTFALQNAEKHDDVAGPGNGYVDVFNTDGTLLQRLVSQGGQINSPWGLDIAPSGWGKYAGDLLVGNFGDGTISVFDPTTGKFDGRLNGPDGKPIVEVDLWGLRNGNGGMGGNANDVFFTAGVSEESHGLFGTLSVPEPATWALMLLGFGLAGAGVRRSRAGLRTA